MKKLTVLLSSLLLAGTALADNHTPDLAAIAKGEHRSEANVARNASRNPVETLEFFGLHPHMRVIELWPGGGWYTEILAPYLKAEGQFTAASFELNPADDSSPAYRVRIGNRYAEKLAADPANYDKVEVVTLDPPRKTSLGIEATADMVLTFRNLHNWAMDDQLEAVFQAAWDVLTPGGVFGVVEHRGYPGIDPRSGYMDQQEVIDLAKKVGFRLAEASEINANAKDTKDHPKGVWTLPPSLRLGDEDRAKYEAIGESDRMTLKFYKPEI
ncbi:class I SAM-dependent methyltransferase [Ferrimonas marina]|uniref:Predicted methyltransferase n=1 Tax=Ferrimonas marina TaxID=299255 RepID=A0A1M5MVD7_9GAMM|nr:class I SAM-dependent methyltransferase [Ferrimonas marina]SHG81147.1 Predicted methyltransferase [Ferrimonas marina]